MRREWDEKSLIASIQELVSRLGRVPTWTETNSLDPGLVMAGFRIFGSWRLAIKAAGFMEYPGNERWRIRVLRGANRDELLKEIATSKSISSGAVRELLKEKGFHKDPILVAELQKAVGSFPQSKPCGRCSVPILPPKRFCSPCSEIVKREKTRARVKRFLSNPANAARYREKVREYQRRRYRKMTPEQKDRKRAKEREYYARRRAQNPELFRLKERIRYYKKRIRELERKRQEIKNSSKNSNSSSPPAQAQ